MVALLRTLPAIPRKLAALSRAKDSYIEHWRQVSVMATMILLLSSHIPGGGDRTGVFLNYEIILAKGLVYIRRLQFRRGDRVCFLNLHTDGDALAPEA